MICLYELLLLLLKLVQLHLSMLPLSCRLLLPAFRVTCSRFWVLWYPQPLALLVPVLLSDMVSDG